MAEPTFFINLPIICICLVAARIRTPHAQYIGGRRGPPRTRPPSPPVGPRTMRVARAAFLLRCLLASRSARAFVPPSRAARAPARGATNSNAAGGDLYFADDVVAAAPPTTPPMAKGDDGGGGAVAFDGGRAGSLADDAFLWDDDAMSGPLGRFADAFFMDRFRTALAHANLRLPEEYPPGYDGMMRMIKESMEDAPSADALVVRSRATLNSLFPDWPPTFGLSDRVGLLFWFEVLFARPFPAFSSKLNAWVTWWAAQWLMGPCDLGDLPGDDDGNDDGEGAPTARAEAGDGRGQLVLVRRCRYLESGSCASLCVNSCKLPTQQFFNEDMGVPMRMVPDYDTYECRFEFGVRPTPEDEEEARSVSCFAGCTSRKRRRDGERMARVSCSTRL